MKTLRFVKMQGIRNDYVYVDCFDQTRSGIDMPSLARHVSDRHAGIGSDGLILITPPSAGVVADVRMEMYNADGSRGEMCGNGIRCVAKYAVENGRVRRRTLPSEKADADDEQGVTLAIETDRGVLSLIAYRTGAIVDRVRVDMGRPILSPGDIPVRYDGARDRCVRALLEVGGRRMHITCVSMGNPHAVAFIDDVASFDLERIGPLVEHHPMFPNRVNFHIAEVHSRSEATMRTWERGSGITQACGTGACAVLVAAVLEDRLDRSALLHLPGGDLDIDWREGPAGGTVFKTGPAVEVFRGEYHLPASL